MKILPLLFIACFSSLLLLFSGCTSFEKGTFKGLPQEVIILSFPTEASVYINGVPTGVTPMKIDLARKLTHEVRLEKRGYNSAVKYFAPVPNEKADNFIRFGLEKDLGFHVDLEPGTMKTEMESGLIPTSTGPDPFERMAQRALAADEKLESGEITPLEHKFIIEQIIDFFYADLEPSIKKTKMISDLVLGASEPDLFEQMAQRTLAADKKLESGEITPSEHKFMIEQIIEFFQEQ